MARRKATPAPESTPIPTIPFANPFAATASKPKVRMVINRQSKKEANKRPFIGGLEKPSRSGQLWLIGSMRAHDGIVVNGIPVPAHKGLELTTNIWINPDSKGQSFLREVIQAFDTSAMQSNIEFDFEVDEVSLGAQDELDEAGNPTGRRILKWDINGTVKILDYRTVARASRTADLADEDSLFSALDEATEFHTKRTEMAIATVRTAMASVPMDEVDEASRQRLAQVQHAVGLI